MSVTRRRALAGASAAAVLGTAERARAAAGKLRRGVKWHDGQDFTSDDVAFSLATVKRLHPRGRLTFAHVVDIATPDAETVVLRLDKPTPYLIKALAAAETAIVPHHVYGDADPLTHHNNIAPIGTGPYVFKEWVRGSYALWERNPNYWDAPFPLIDRLVVKFIPDAAARTIAFESGDVDIGYRTPVPYRDVARLQKLPKITMESKGYEYNPPNIIIVEANLNQEDLKKLPVRQAIAHCIDREALARIVYFGQALPSPTPVVPFNKPFHSSKPSPYPYDPKAAEALLDAAGYHREGSGPRLRLILDYTGEEVRPVAEFLRATFSRAGIALELRTQDVASLLKRVYTDRDFNLHLLQLSNLFDPNVGVQRIYWSKNYITGVLFSNGTHYANPEVDALLEAAATETDPDKRVAMWMRIQDIVMTDVPNFPLVMAYWQTIAQSKIKDHTVTAEGFEGSMSRIWIDA
jgi:peptide/nickel transport system substrate-binding protein